MWATPNMFKLPSHYFVNSEDIKKKTTNREKIKKLNLFLKKLILFFEN